MAYRNAYNDEGSSRDSSLGPSESENVEVPRKKNLDRRRETSRYAARDRRGKEADIFIDLKEVVPVVEESTVTHVDRIALLRVASTMCRMRRNAAKFLETELPPEDPEVNVFAEQVLTECMDGFVLLADSDGTILYVSESVSVFLGLTQTDLVGRFLTEFVHNDDYEELVRMSTTDCDGEEVSTLDDFGRYLVVRMKTVISPRGRTLNLKSALFKAILCRFRAVTTEYGRLSLLYGSSTPAGQGNSILLANASVKGSEATNGVFMTRHTVDMRFSYVSDSFNFLLRHETRSLMGTSFYELVHPADIHTVAQSMRELFKKGHSRTAFYRLLGANSSVAWVQTEATTVNHTARGQKGQYVLCVHSIIGMQSESDSWSDPVMCEDSLAANPAYCTSQIKREIPDMAEYMGKQPEFIECVDFTPLIDPVADVNFTEFPRAQESRSTSKTRPADFDDDVPIKQKRKKSFDDVLNWLVRDEADNPPPPFSQGLEYVPPASDGGDQFFNEIYAADHKTAQFNGTGGANSFRRFNGYNDNTETFGYASQFVDQSPPLDFDPRPQESWPNTNSTPTAAVAGRDDPRGGTASTALYNRQQYAPNTGDVGGRREFDGRPRTAAVPMETADTQRDFFLSKATPNEGQRFSRYDVHQRQQFARQSQQPARDAGTHGGAPFARNRSAGTGALPAIPTTVGYFVPTSQPHDAHKPRGGPNPALYSALPSANPHKKAAGARDSSRTNQRSADSSIQCLGEFNGRNGLQRSRSGSATSTGSCGYGNSAMRRYAQTSPSPQSPRFPVDRRRSTEPREQRALNVNHLNAVKMNAMVKSPPNNTHNTNFYYAARKPSATRFPQQQMNYEQSTRPNVSPHKRSALPSHQFEGYTQQNCGAPAKRMAYGQEIPQALANECDPQKDGFYCDDLSRLAPFVAGDDVMQLEDLDLQNMFPEVDFGEFFAAEVSPPGRKSGESSISPPVASKLNTSGQDMPQYVGEQLDEWGFNRY